jgi:hypothetical protein
MTLSMLVAAVTVAVPLFDPPADPPQPDRARVAEAIRASYAKHQSFVVAAKISHEQRVITTISIMSPDFFRADLFQDGDRIFSMRSVRGHITECAPRAPVNDQDILNPAIEYDVGTTEVQGQFSPGWPVLLPPADACAAASILDSWLSVAPTMPSTLAEKITAGHFVGTATIDSSLCDVFEVTNISGGPADKDAFTVTHRISVRRTDSMIARWDTTEREGQNPPVLRTREYTLLPDSLFPTLRALPMRTPMSADPAPQAAAEPAAKP